MARQGKKCSENLTLSAFAEVAEATWKRGAGDNSKDKMKMRKPLVQLGFRCFCADRKAAKIVILPRVSCFGTPLAIIESKSNFIIM